MFCSICGAEIDDKAVVCVKCGCAVSHTKDIYENAISKDWIITLLLCFFCGTFGVHRFYVGKVGTGILQLITLGGCGVWTIIDFIFILVGNFTDKDGKLIVYNRS